MAQFKINELEAAKGLGKSESYIKKRLVLLTLPVDVKQAVISKKIQLGHALLLAKMPKNDATKFLKEITRQDYSVAAAKSGIMYREQSMNLSGVKFNTDNCKTCKHNGSVQSELFETGKTLNGRCLNPGCFNKKTAEKVKQIRAEFKGVIFKGESDYSRPKGLVDGEHSYECRDKKITDVYKKKLRKERVAENYQVTISDTGKITEYFKPPKSKAGPTDEKQKVTSRSDKLKDKINGFKRDVLIDKTRVLLKPGNKVLALALRDLILRNYCNEFQDESLKAIGLKENEKGYTKNILNLSKEKIDVGMVAISKIAVSNISDLKDLEVAAMDFGFDWKSYFVMTEEYLKLYTKDSMIKLAKELKIEVSECKKNKDFRDTIIKNWKKGQVPKILR